MLNPEEIETLLRPIAHDYQSKLYPVVEAKLAGSGFDRELQVLEWAFERYNKGEAGFWYDPYHVLFSALFAIESVAAGRASRLVIPAVVLHDIEYPSETTPQERAKGWTRVTHMWNGAAWAAERLSVAGDWGKLEVCRIAEMIATHDYPYIDEGRQPPFDDDDTRAVRNADRMFVMHFLSFYKDWARKVNEAKKKGKLELTPADLLRLRLARFYHFSSEELPLDRGEMTKEMEQEQKEHFPSEPHPPFSPKEPALTELAKSWRNTQFRSRYHEIHELLIVEDATEFSRYARSHIQKEVDEGEPVFGD